eukprot:maker-scaffold861_size87375-snap-gene-0.21 protein:Tk02187 transcript:maker-scaffold861_size87375-snap-gene-0.21-mRNA-1 annotation:"PREDICTED: uncharacterized protein LOC100203306"
MEGEGAVFHWFQFVVGLEVRESPQSAIDDMRETFLLGYLRNGKVWIECNSSRREPLLHIPSRPRPPSCPLTASAEAVASLGSRCKPGMHSCTYYIHPRNDFFADQRNVWPFCSPLSTNRAQASLLQSSWFRLVAIDFGIQWVGCILAIVFKTEKFYDLTGSMTFILITYLSQAWSDHSWRQFIQSHMVMAWACRLGLFLFLRVMKDGQDKRFDEAKQEPLRFLVFWTLQGVWVIVTLLPTLWLNDNSRRVPIGIRDYIGWGIWVLGMFFEVTADLQKSIFRNNPDNKSKFIQSGLWSISRHPNYFGEILLWYGLYISASSVFRGSEYLLVLSPIFVQLLITKVSGIPLLEKASDKKWANLAEYQTYKRNTSVLVPFWPCISFYDGGHIAAGQKAGSSSRHQAWVILALWPGTLSCCQQ